ncbi:hypothetical protein BGW80DRAFT_1383335 [Lactifluus volemus]|nr:hypothetical protein BGW80DRAFT_1383335 [Lactifluus volemus]
MPLSSLFDISQPTDCLRAALNMLTEYEQAKEENDRPKMTIPTLCSRFWTFSTPSTPSSSGPRPSQHMLGLSHPHPYPGASFLFHNQTSADECHPGPLNSPPPSWTPALGEHVVKVNGKFKVPSLSC